MAKKKHHEEHENHERWLVSYADFITLLFAFFVILFIFLLIFLFYFYIRILNKIYSCGLGYFETSTYYFPNATETTSCNPN